jgi:hypothetical protein
MACSAKWGTVSLLLLALAGSLGAVDDPEALLQGTRQKVMDTVERLPRYVCTQTVTRSHYEPERGAGEEAPSCRVIAVKVQSSQWEPQLVSSDRIRLDVAVNRDPSGVDGEMYSFVGAERFSGRELFESLLPGGAMPTGTFSSMLASIFGGKGAEILYTGDHTVGERSLDEFGFRVPQNRSAYWYVFGRGSNQKARVAYDGVLLVDGQSADLVQLFLHADTVPPETGACQLTRSVNYGRVRLHGSDFLLPTEARLQVIHADESVEQAVVQYSSCREFRGESRIRFEPPAPVAPRESQSEERTSHEVNLPPGLRFRVAFTDPIDPKLAAAGDSVRGRIIEAIRNRSGALVPEGTTITGRIIRIQRFYAGANSRDPSLKVAIRLESFEVSGTSYPLKAAFASGLQRFAKSAAPLTKHVEIGSLNDLQDSGAAVFEFRNANPDAVIERGLESNWRTLGP